MADVSSFRFPFLCGNCGGTIDLQVEWEAGTQPQEAAVTCDCGCQRVEPLPTEPLGKGSEAFTSPQPKETR